MAQESSNQVLMANAGDMQAKIDAQQEKKQRLELDLAVAKAPVTAQKAMVAGMLQRLSVTAPAPEAGTL